MLAFRTNERINKWTSFDINIHIGKRMLWFKFKSNANCSAPFIQPFIRSPVHSVVHSFVRLCAISYCIYRFLIFSRFSECEYKLMFTQNLSSLNSTEKSLFFSFYLSMVLKLLLLPPLFFVPHFIFQTQNTNWSHRWMQPYGGKLLHCNYIITSCFWCHL